MSARVVVTGSRTWTDARTRVHGACPRGVDELAARWCMRHQVPQEGHPARWAALGRRAGIVRNAEMVESGPLLVLAFIRAGSPGASHCARYAAERGVPVRRWTA